jgi:glycosyltransferase involved in cell wall biosynthesis
MDKKVSCIIPAYNEEKTITDTIKTALETPEIGEVIAVNDGSEDKTKEKVSNLQFSNFQNKKYKFINLKNNQGKGYAVIQGVKQSQYPYLLFLDADLINLKPYQLSSLIQPVISNKVDMTIGPQISLQKPRWIIGTLPFCGQRCFKKLIIKPHLKKLAKSKYGLEVLLNQLFNDKKVIVVPLIGNDIDHLLKPHKEKDWVKNYAKEIWQITQKSIQTKSETTQQRIKEQFLFNLSAYLKLNVKKIKEYIES